MLMFESKRHHGLRAWAISAALCSAVFPFSFTAAENPARPTSPSQIRIPVSDARNIGANSIRFGAIQASRDRPAILLFGGNKEVWAKIVAGTQQAVFEGYPVWGIFVGPADAPRSLEIYAKGHHVTNPIDPFKISQSELTKLIRDVCREYYPAG